jgi:hypothetical protein
MFGCGISETAGILQHHAPTGTMVEAHAILARRGTPSAPRFQPSRKEEGHLYVAQKAPNSTAFAPDSGEPMTVAALVFL